MTSLSRRHLLRGHWKSARLGQTEQRPPWAIPDPLFTDQCTRCAECIRQCETGVLTTGEGGFPIADFSRAECTFCRRCADSCTLPLFQAAQQAPWSIKAEIGPNCLSACGTECRSCQDVCEVRAIRFIPQAGGVAKLALDTAVCTGCGACVSICPVQAVRMTHDVRNNNE